MRYRPGDRADRSTASARLATATSPARVADPSSQCSLMVAVWEASPSVSTVRRSHPMPSGVTASDALTGPAGRSEEHTSELQSQSNLVCRLLLEKKNKDKSPACGVHQR